ncbi:hypothetical protein K505DRAFT_261000 [Melanomma pulvis-pyrius CBS 109.77]|uniref:Uncharacterized protein n=1 Tax=Melanomma pulvis-pyrius CBS 109.77 TaxID=1314802 RepID=A0A6A6WPQ2_9PLEO|nr:hypothetical protein K505DRAFT_261000 [Melanomma pulvis-pyrius CBS 109.77]
MSFSTGSLNRRGLDFLLHGDAAETICVHDDKRYSNTSTADVFEVRDGRGDLRTRLNDEQIAASIKTDLADVTSSRVRIYFVDAIVDDGDRLPLTRTTLKLLCDSYQVTPRFTDLLWWQYMPEIKRKFWKNFSEVPGARLQEHSMFAHMFILQHAAMTSIAIQNTFSNPLYKLEELSTENLPGKVHTIRAQEFLALCRRFEQIAVDYDILDAAIDMVKCEAKYYENVFCRPLDSIAAPDRQQNLRSPNMPSKDASTILEDMLSRLKQDSTLIRSYNRLYRQRSKIGVNECFALVNQKDAEQNNRTALESASIARASRTDNLSLRSIQYMTMFFLPSSLVASIFGMGFFSTDKVDGKRNPELIVSTKWWIWLAISVPVTVVCFTLVTYGAGWTVKKKREVEERDLVQGDTEGKGV